MAASISFRDMRPDAADSACSTAISTHSLVLLDHKSDFDAMSRPDARALAESHAAGVGWPVFYNIKTLEVIKAEATPGKGGEHDVGALYAHVMLAAFDLSGDQRFVDEAKRAASRLRGFGFDLAYQYNNVSFGAGALYRLWKMTGDEQYRGLSDICWANVIRNLGLWDCNYGNAKHYGTFMGLAPLQDAPYVALHEELEVLAAIHTYLALAGDDVPSPLRVLLPEYCKYLIDRAWFHYPSVLPIDVLAEKPKTGDTHRYLSVPVEDIGEGWNRAGSIGQEVYGASTPFIIATRHCHTVPGEAFTIHCSYPVSHWRSPAKASSAARSSSCKATGVSKERSASSPTISRRFRNSRSLGSSGRRDRP